MQKFKILWVDDEVDLLKPHILFLENKNYQITSCNSGTESIDIIENERFDIVLLDENMPGLSGLETLSEIKERQPSLPVIMVTKSEEERIMEEAIGSKISDYLIKPVNPNQLLLSLKKNLDHNKLVTQKTTSAYQQEFRKISMDIMQARDYDDWTSIYKKLVHWEMQLEDINDSGMLEILMNQKEEANLQFFKFIEDNYEDWLHSKDKPQLSHTVFKDWIMPELSKNQPTLLVVIDNFRLDQWRAIETKVLSFTQKQQESNFYSILPTATQYARNAFFSGLLPLEMKKRYPNYWKDDTDEGGKNLFEKEFLEAQLKRLGANIKFEYHKITSEHAGRKLAENFKTQRQNDLSVVVYNFVDMISHAKTEMEVIKDLASTDKAFRSLTKSWFSNSPLLEIMHSASQLGFKIILTTDHGTINVKNPSKVIGDKNTSLNLRYKTGKSLSYENRDVLAYKNPEDIYLPSIHMSSSFIFAKGDLFFAYPNNYNHYVKYFKNTFQHGGISMEEMIVPFVVLNPK